MTRARFALILAIALYGTVGLAQSPLPTYSIDLTQQLLTNLKDGVPAERRLQLPIIFESHAKPKPELPLRLTLRSMDASEYRTGERYVVELLLLNSGSEAIAIPSSIDPSLVSAEDPGASIAILRLLLQSSAYVPVTNVVATLYGSVAQPKTITILKPGESLQLRAASQWIRLNVDSDTKAWSNRSIPVRAEFRLHFKGADFAPAVSTNAIAVTIREK